MKSLASLLLCLAIPIGAAEFDLAIRNGRIVDGTGNPWFYGDVAVHGDRIVNVGRVTGAAKREIDARGLTVAPGFIDMHSHSDWTLFEDGNAESKIRQGVTTEILGESTSPGPFKGKLPVRKVIVKGEPMYIRELRDYFNALERSGISVNVATYVGQGQVWECVMGSSFDRPSIGQSAQMKDLIREAMADGAFGLSIALMMPPSSLATTEDLVELCKVVREFGGIYSTHMRDEGLGVFDSVKESIRIGELSGVPVDIIHLKIADQKYWGRMGEVVALIEEARGRGVNVQANVYPYTRGNNDLRSIIPPWAHEGGTDKMLERLRDLGQRDRLKRDIREGLKGWYNHYLAVGGDWGRMLISANNPYKGMTMAQVIERRSAGKNPAPDALDVLFDVLIEQGGSVGTIFEHHTEADMNLALRQPWCSIGSDGSALATEGILRRGNPHPRSFGTFPRALGLYAREKAVLRLEDAVRKMTSLNAAKIGIKERGLLRAGMFADIVIFDEKQVKDRATYEDPFQYPEGIQFVLVNGKTVLENGKHTGARPGSALRHETPVFATNAKLEKLNATHAGEGPAWSVSAKKIFFTGVDKISSFDSTNGEQVFREPSGGANGLLFDPEGRLVACEARLRRVTRTEKDGSIVVLADQFEGKKFNSPNDLTIDGAGRIYFTDPRYGPRDTMEMDLEGVYQIDAPGKVTRIIGREVNRPNGILVSPDQKHLFVADNNNNTIGGARKLWRFDLLPDGSVDLKSQKLLFDWKTSRGPDGLKMDTRNRLFVAAGLNKANPPFETVEPHPAGVYVLTAEGEQLDFVPVPKDEVTNCAFGDDDLKTLYITGGSVLWKIRVNAPGRISSRP